MYIKLWLGPSTISFIAHKFILPTQTLDKLSRPIYPAIYLTVFLEYLYITIYPKLNSWLNTLPSKKKKKVLFEHFLYHWNGNTIKKVAYTKHLELTSALIIKCCWFYPLNRHPPSTFTIHPHPSHYHLSLTTAKAASLMAPFQLHLQTAH